MFGDALCYQLHVLNSFFFTWNRITALLLLFICLFRSYSDLKQTIFYM